MISLGQRSVVQFGHILQYGKAGGVKCKAYVVSVEWIVSGIIHLSKAKTKQSVGHDI
jgi:hypothetical protein